MTAFTEPYVDDVLIALQDFGFLPEERAINEDVASKMVDIFLGNPNSLTFKVLETIAAMLPGLHTVSVVQSLVATCHYHDENCFTHG
jgi:hypothetical protein